MIPNHLGLKSKFVNFYKLSFKSTQVFALLIVLGLMPLATSQAAYKSAFDQSVITVKPERLMYPPLASSLADKQAKVLGETTVNLPQVQVITKSPGISNNFTYVNLAYAAFNDQSNKWKLNVAWSRKRAAVGRIGIFKVNTSTALFSQTANQTDTLTTDYILDSGVVYSLRFYQTTTSNARLGYIVFKTPDALAVTNSLLNSSQSGSGSNSNTNNGTNSLSTGSTGTVGNTVGNLGLTQPPLNSDPGSGSSGSTLGTSQPQLPKVSNFQPTDALKAAPGQSVSFGFSSNIVAQSSVVALSASNFVNNFVLSKTFCAQLNCNWKLTGTIPAASQPGFYSFYITTTKIDGSYENNSFQLQVVGTSTTGLSRGSAAISLVNAFGLTCKPGSITKCQAFGVPGSSSIDPTVLNAINILYDNSITVGCSIQPDPFNPNNQIRSFCENDPILRWQFAVFLGRILELKAFNLGSATYSPYSDVQDTTNPAYNYIVKLSNLNVISGFQAGYGGGSMFYPNNNLTQADMQAAILAAKQLLLNPPVVTTPSPTPTPTPAINPGATDGGIVRG